MRGIYATKLSTAIYSTRHFLLSLLIVLITSVSAYSQSPEAQINYGHSGTNIQVGETYSMFFSLKNTGGTSITSYGFIDVSFRKLNQETTPNVSVSVTSNAFDNIQYFEEGDLIWDKNDNQIPAEYKLISFFEKDWSSGEQQSVFLDITPQEPGDYIVQFRGTFTEENMNTHIDEDPTGSEGDGVDQQGWRVYQVVFHATQPVDFDIFQPSQAYTVEQGDVFVIQWDVSNLENPGHLALAYDSDCSPGYHQYLTADTVIGNGVGSYYWDTDNVPAGTYKIWGNLYDGSNEYFDCAAGTVTIDDSNPLYWTVTPEEAQIINFGDSASYDVYIEDKDGNPVEGIKVEWWGLQDCGKNRSSTYSDVDGHAIVKAAPDECFWKDCMYYDQCDGDIRIYLSDYNEEGYDQTIPSRYDQEVECDYSSLYCAESEQLYTVDEHTLASYSFCDIYSDPNFIFDNSNYRNHLWDSNGPVPTLANDGYHQNCLQWNDFTESQYSGKDFLPYYINQFTIELYVLFDNVKSNSYTHIGTSQAEKDVNDEALDITISSDNIHFDAGSYGEFEGYITGLIDDGEWHHIAFQYEDGFVYVMIDDFMTNIEMDLGDSIYFRRPILRGAGDNDHKIDELRISDIVRYEIPSLDPCPSDEQYYTLDDTTVASYSFCSTDNIFFGFADNSLNNYDLLVNTDRNNDKIGKGIFPDINENGKHGSCLEWGDYYAEYRTANFSMNSQDFTLEFHLKGTNPENYSSNFGIGLTNHENENFDELSIEAVPFDEPNSGSLNVNYYSGVGPKSSITLNTNENVLDDSWHHVAVQKKEDHLYLILDDVVVDHGQLETNETPIFSEFTISGESDSENGDLILLDEIRISNEARYETTLPNLVDNGIIFTFFEMDENGSWQPVDASGITFIDDDYENLVISENKIGLDFIEENLDYDDLIKSKITFGGNPYNIDYYYPEYLNLNNLPLRYDVYLYPNREYFDDETKQVAWIITTETPQSVTGNEPILMVEGTYPASNYWAHGEGDGNSFRQEFTGSGHDVFEFNYPSLQNIRQSAAMLGEVTKHIKSRYYENDVKFNVVTHSQGGLVARAYTVGMGEYNHPDYVGEYTPYEQEFKKLIQIAPTNHGGEFIYLGEYSSDFEIADILKRFDIPATKMQACGSKFLWELNGEPLCDLDGNTGTSIENEYLVIAGHFSLILWIAEEHDYVLSATSASLMDFADINLCMLNYSHSSLLSNDNARYKCNHLVEGFIYGNLNEDVMEPGDFLLNRNNVASTVIANEKALWGGVELNINDGGQQSNRLVEVRSSSGGQWYNLFVNNNRICDSYWIGAPPPECNEENWQYDGQGLNDASEFPAFIGENKVEYNGDEDRFLYVLPPGEYLWRYNDSIQSGTILIEAGRVTHQSLVATPPSKHMHAAAYCPVDLEITLPDGRIITKDSVYSDEYAVVYHEYDFYNMPRMEFHYADYQDGIYDFQIIPHDTADVTDSVLLIVQVDGVIDTIVNNQQIQDIDSIGDPYSTLDTGSVSGHLISAGDPVEGIPVILSDSAGIPIDSMTTGIDGYYEFSGLINSYYEVTIMPEPCYLTETPTQSIFVEGLPHQLDFELDYVNTAPVCVVPENQTIEMCSSDLVKLPFDVIDEEDNVVSIQIVDGPGELVNGFWEYTPTDNETVSVTIQSVDICEEICEETFEITFDFHDLWAVLTIDRSGSMVTENVFGESRLNRAKELAQIDLLRLMDPSDTLYPGEFRVAVMYFNDDSIVIAQDFTSDYDALSNAIDGVPFAINSTPLAAAMCHGFCEMYDLYGDCQKYLFTYTDGLENRSEEFPMCEICDTCNDYMETGWEYDCDPSNPETCTDWQICLNNSLSAEGLNIVHYFGEPIDSAQKNPAPEDMYFMVSAAKNSGGSFNYHPDVPESICGDANGDLTMNISDAVFIINYAFAGGPAPDPLFTGDTNCDSSVDISDSVYIINYAFAGGNPPCDTNGDGVPDC